jgi:phenolic acid decarboxylase
MHQGEAMIIPTEELKRVGPLADIVQSLTGFPGDFFVLSANQTSWELRVYANQATLLDYPAHAVYINGIVNV